MPLLNFEKQKPIYATMRGVDTNAPGASSALFQFAATFINSNKITQNSSSRITFQEDGTYEITIGLSHSTNGTNRVAQYQTGLGGVWTTQHTCPNATFAEGHFKFIVEAAGGTYLEIRCLLNGTSAQFGTICKSTSLSYIPTTTVIRKVR